jgi:tetratricopeptide (TPR) repeat protein
MSSRLLACTLLLLASANWAAAQSCCPAMGGCTAKPADLPVNTTDDCVVNIQVGQIVIVGNERTPQNVILQSIPFSPGQIISDTDLRRAEANLAKLDIFDDGSMVEVLDPDGVVPVKDILVTVYEKCGAFRCGPEGGDDEDQEAPKAKCGCDDCSCCGCMNKPGAECACKGECKCCGCKTVDTVVMAAQGIPVIVPDGGTVILAGLKFSANLDADEECECDKEGCKCEKGKCKCDKDSCECEKGKCDCCDKESDKCEKGKCIRHVVVEEAGVQTEYDLVEDEPCSCEKEKCNCEKGKCKCEEGKCGCCEKDAGKESGSDCASGKCGEEKCDTEKCEKCGEVKSKTEKCGKCCEKAQTGCCPFCPHSTSACSITWYVMEGMCPGLRICAMCPWMKEQVQEVLKSCWKCFVAQCKQTIKDAKAAKGAKATPCPGEKAVGEETSSEEAGEPQAKKSCHGCGQCANAGKNADNHVHVWHFRWFSGKVAVGWKCGEKAQECPCSTEKAAEKAAAEGAEEAADKASEPAKTVCPYLQKKQQDKQEKPVSAAELYEQLGTPLENLAKLEKAHALYKKGQHFCEAGEYDRAIKCFTRAKDLCPGSRWEVQASEGLQLAQAMKEMDEKVRTVTRELMEKLLDQAIHKQAATTVEESGAEQQEPVQEESLPCQEPKAMREYKQKFSDLLDQAKSACAIGDLEQARYLAQEAASLATPEVMEKVKALIDGARDCFNSGCTADGWEMLNTAMMLDPSCEEARVLQDQMILKNLNSRCDECDTEPCDTLPPNDEDAPPCDTKEDSDPCSDDGEEQEACLVIDFQTEDLDLVADDCAQCDESTPADLQEQVQQLIDVIRENFSMEVDRSKSQPGCARLWVQIGGVEYLASFNANFPSFVQMKVIAPAAADIKAAQQTNIDETIHWIEAMNGGKVINDGDSEEAEEPLYMLETDLDPNW